MTKKQIQFLAQESFTGGQLDAEKAEAITQLFKRSDLKQYITLLKRMIAKKTLYVESAQPVNEQVLSTLSELFPGKHIETSHNPSLIAGLKVIDDDVMYNASVKDALDEQLEYIEEN